MNLTDEDKRWISAELGKFTTKSDFERLNAELGKFASKSDLERLKEELTGFITSAVAASEHRTREYITDIETKLLTEFHKWASPQEARLRTHSAALRAVDLEMEALADRVAKLEPPH